MASRAAPLVSLPIASGRIFLMSALLKPISVKVLKSGKALRSPPLYRNRAFPFGVAMTMPSTGTSTNLPCSCRLLVAISNAKRICRVKARCNIYYSICLSNVHYCLIISSRGVPSSDFFVTFRWEFHSGTHQITLVLFYPHTSRHALIRLVLSVSFLEKNCFFRLS